MKKLILLFTLTINVVAASENIAGIYTYVDGTNHEECPGVEMIVKGNEESGYAFYGSTDINAKGPFANSFYFFDINNGETKEGNYIYKTESSAGQIIKNSKFIINKKTLIEEDIVFKINKSSAVLEYKLLKNSPAAKQWRHESFKCFYTKN